MVDVAKAWSPKLRHRITRVQSQFIYRAGDSDRDNACLEQFRRSSYADCSSNRFVGSRSSTSSLAFCHQPPARRDSLWETQQRQPAPELRWIVSTLPMVLPPRKIRLVAGTHFIEAKTARLLRKKKKRRFWVMRRWWVDGLPAARWLRRYLPLHPARPPGQRCFSNFREPRAGRSGGKLGAQESEATGNTLALNAINSFVANNGTLALDRFGDHQWNDNQPKPDGMNLDVAEPQNNTS